MICRMKFEVNRFNGFCLSGKPLKRFKRNIAIALITQLKLGVNEI